MHDGPLAKAKDIGLDFFPVDVETRAEALAITKECPAIERTTLGDASTGRSCHQG